MTFNLKAIVAQKLLATIVDQPPTRAGLRSDDLQRHDPQIDSGARRRKAPGGDPHRQDGGMQQFNDSLYYFLKKEFISRAEAFEVSPNAEELKMMLKGIDVKGGEFRTFAETGFSVPAMARKPVLHCGDLRIDAGQFGAAVFHAWTVFAVASARSGVCCGQVTAPPRCLQVQNSTSRWSSSIPAASTPRENGAHRSRGG